MTPAARGPGRTKAEPAPEHDPEHPDQEPGQESADSSEEPDTSAQQPQGSGSGQKGALVDPSKSTEEVREDQAESYRESGEDEEPSESEQLEQERLEYHQSIQDEIRAQQEEAGTVEEYPNAEERAVKTAPAPGQVPGDHIPVG